MREDTITIDGTNYDVPVIALHNTGEFLDKSAERTIDGNLKRELIGFYSNYDITFASGYSRPAAYKALWEKITTPTEFHEITLWDQDGEFTFWGYFANPSRELIKIKSGVTYWKGFSVSVVTKQPTRAA